VIGDHEPERAALDVELDHRACRDQLAVHVERRGRVELEVDRGGRQVAHAGLCREPSGAQSVRVAHKP
jgi:hypothetical protein